MYYDYGGFVHSGPDVGYCVLCTGYCRIYYLIYFDYVAKGFEMRRILGQRGIVNGPEANDLLGRRDMNITAIGIATFREQAPLMGELVNTSVTLSELSFGAILM